MFTTEHNTLFKKRKEKSNGHYNSCGFFGIKISAGQPSSRDQMFQFFHQFRCKKKREAPIFSAPLAPMRPLYVIGDIHGRDDLLDPLLRKIEAHAGGVPHDIVTVGDYVDRGENSAAVLNRLLRLSALPHVTCLMGNHERMLLDFIDEPGKNGRSWIHNGGLQTLASFGVGGLSETAGSQALTDGRDQLLVALGPLEPWLRALPVTFQSGNIAVTHAGADPRLPIENQTEKTFLWGHPAFFQEARKDDIWVTHGHTIVETARSENGRISIDTGAYATGRLTAAAVSENAVQFV